MSFLKFPLSTPLSWPLKAFYIFKIRQVLDCPMLKGDRVVQVENIRNREIVTHFIGKTEP